MKGKKVLFLHGATSKDLNVKLHTFQARLLWRVNNTESIVSPEET